MKNSTKIMIGALCITAMLGSAFALHAAVAEAAKDNSAAEVAASEDGFIGKEIRMRVCVSKLQVYSTKNGNTLSGEASSYLKNAEITVKPVSELIYAVYSNNMLRGYCYASGLVELDTKLVAKLPCLWKVITVATPVADPDAPEGSEPEYTYEDKTVFTDLVDINELAYRPASNVAISDDTVLAQRDLLTALSKISTAGYDFSIDEGYGSTLIPSDCEVSAKSGAVVRLKLIDNDGKSTSVSSVNGLAEELADAGILRHGESDWFYLENYGDYMEADFTSSDYIYTVFG